MTTRTIPICPYCRQRSVLKRGRSVYPHCNAVADHWFWVCKPCDAWAGCHRTGDYKSPLGTLANASLRDLRKTAHAAFDPLWVGCTVPGTRKRAYHWMAEQLGIHKKHFHMASLDEDGCSRVIDVCLKLQVSGQFAAVKAQLSQPRNLESGRKYHTAPIIATS